MRKFDTLPDGLRLAIANALSARNRSSEFLGTMPEVAFLLASRNVEEYKYPWYVRMLYFRNDRPYLLCGGTVYNERTIISAAHCVEHDTTQADGYYVIIAGEHDKTAPNNFNMTEGLAQIVLVDDVIMHPGFRYSGTFGVHDDVALFITDVPLNFNTIAVRPVPSLSTRRKDKMALRSDNCVAIGFGLYTHVPSNQRPNILQEFSPVNFVTNRECNNVLSEIEYGVTPKMVCSIEPNAGTCWGDSGGPNGCYDNNGDFYLVGITSWSPKPNGICGEYANVYMRVSKYLRWIKFFSYSPDRQSQSQTGIVEQDATAMPTGDRRNPIGLIQRGIDTMADGLRITIANALSARNRPIEFLGISQTPEIAPTIGDRDAVEYKYPWFAQVRYFPNGESFYYVCGGTIYNEKTIITSGFCASVDIDQTDGYYVVLAGAHDRSVTEGLEQVVLVDDIRRHPGYRRSGAFIVHDDIALLIIDVPLNFTTRAVKPVPSLSTRRKDKMALKSDNCVAFGDGIYEQTPSVQFPDILQEFSPVNFVTNRECHKDLWRSEYSVTLRMICSIDRNVEICAGDSGGSIGCYDNEGVFYQVGMTSWSLKPNGRCGEYAHVYTRMSKYLRWIKYFSYRV